MAFEFPKDSYSGKIVEATLGEDVPLDRIAGRVGTPAYVYSKASIRRAYQQLDSAFHGVPHTVCYAVKAMDSNLAVLRLFARLGSGFDIVSGGELDRLRSIGVSGKGIVFSGVGKTPEEIRKALREGVLMLNVESEAELELVAREAARLGRPAPAAIRVNPDVAAGGHPHISTGHHLHKFGVDWSDAHRLYRAWKDSRWIEWRGLSAHIGSQILSVAPFERAVRRLASYVRELHRDGIRLRYFDFGGGVGIRYWKEQPLAIGTYARAVASAIRPLGFRVLTPKMVRNLSLLDPRAYKSGLIGADPKGLFHPSKRLISFLLPLLSSGWGGSGLRVLFFPSSGRRR